MVVFLVLVCLYDGSLQKVKTLVFFRMVTLSDQHIIDIWFDNLDSVYFNQVTDHLSIS